MGWPEAGCRLTPHREDENRRADRFRVQERPSTDVWYCVRPLRNES